MRPPIWLGIEPEKLFWLMSKCFKLMKFNISLGMGPDKLLRDIDSILRFLRFAFGAYRDGKSSVEFRMDESGGQKDTRPEKSL